MSLPAINDALVQNRRARRVEAALLILAVLATIAAARLAQDFLIPVVVGIFGAYALRPVVDGLRALHVPEVLAAGLVMLVLVLTLLGGGYLLRGQAVSALAELPQAAHALRMHLRALVNNGEPSSISHVKEAAAELKKAASEVSGSSTSPLALPAPAAGPDLFDRLASNGVNALGALGTAGIALAVTLFLLAAGDTFRRKLVNVAGDKLAERRVALKILDEIDHQIQRYLLVMLVTNVILGFVLWGVYTALGLERPAFWAVVTAVLHTIPYLGVVLGLTMMGTVAMLQFGSLGAAIATVAATVLFSIAIGLFLQNWLQGKAARMNPVAVFIAVLFFGWLWGAWGLLLGAPLIAILRTIASHITALGSLNEFLSDRSRKARPSPSSEPQAA
jgi:predicted PurR-regulated permease PerM